MRNPCKECDYYHKKNNTCQSKKCCTGGDGYITWIDRLFCKPYRYNADRKTENCSEKPNNSTCSKMEQDEDEPQTYVISPQEPTNDDKCFECDDFFTCGGQCNKIEDKLKTQIKTQNSNLTFEKPDCPWK